jgi:hypothetical protein
MATTTRPRATEEDLLATPDDVRTLGPDDALDGEDVLPGFRCTLREIL